MEKRVQTRIGLLFNYLVIAPAGLAFFLWVPMTLMVPWLTLQFNNQEISRDFQVSAVKIDEPTRVGCNDRMGLAAEGFVYREMCMEESTLASYAEGDTILVFGPENPMGILIRRVEKITP